MYGNIGWELLFRFRASRARTHIMEKHMEKKLGNNEMEAMVQ